MSVPYPPQSASFVDDNADLRFYIEQWIRWEDLARECELQGFSAAQADEGEGFASPAEARAFYAEVLDMVGGLVAQEVAPHAAALDREGVHMGPEGTVVPNAALEGIFETLRETGLHGLCVPRELGGMNAPLMLYFLTAELFARADVSVMAHHGFHGGIAMALLMYAALEGSADFDPATGRIRGCRFSEAIRDIVENGAWGSMDITEPDAGSDMGALRSTATQDADGQWRVTGQKIFITSGHGRYHIVIARTEAPAASDDPMAGLGGLSLFLVPAWTETAAGERVAHVVVERVEEKLGHHSSTTVAVSFENAPAELIGARGEGFKLMLLLMNNARISVGFEGIGLIESALRLARAYAQNRESMGKTIDRHEIIADYLDEMEIDLVGLRAMAVEAGLAEELAQRTRLRARYLAEGPEDRARLEAQVRRLTLKSRRRTPVLKYLAAEKAVEHARRCVQIHGGAGYMKEYGAEKLLRDALVLPIYEGTSQIQALMATKDTLLGVMRDPGRFLRGLAQANYRARAARDLRERRVAGLRAQVLTAQRVLMARIASDKAAALRGASLGDWRRGFTEDWDPKRDFGPALLHAERLTRMLADADIAELLFAQARQHPERGALLDRHLDRAEPRARFLLDTIRTTGDGLLARLRATAAAPDAAAAR